MPILKSNDTVITGAIPPYFQDEIKLRILDSEFKDSKSGNPMIVWETEILAPDKLEVDGKSYDLTTCKLGFGGKVYLTMKSEKEDNWGLLLNVIHPKLGLPSEEIDTDNPNMEIYRGVIFTAIVTSKEKIVTRKENGKFVAVLDPNTNKPKSLGWELNFDWKNNIIGVSTDEVGVPH